MSGTSYDNILDDEGGERNADIHIIAAWAEAQAVLQVDDAVFAERLYRFTRCGVQGDEGIARRHCEDDSFAIIVVIAQSFSGALSRGIVEALTFFWAPHP